MIGNSEDADMSIAIIFWPQPP